MLAGGADFGSAFAVELDAVVLLGLAPATGDVRLDAERDGPSRAATAAERSIELDGASADTFGNGSELRSEVRCMKLLNSYFAGGEFSRGACG